MTQGNVFTIVQKQFKDFEHLSVLSSGSILKVSYPTEQMCLFRFLFLKKNFGGHESFLWRH